MPWASIRSFTVCKVHQAPISGICSVTNSLSQQTLSVSLPDEPIKTGSLGETRLVETE